MVCAVCGHAGPSGTTANDGKTERGSGIGGECAIHMVSPCSIELGLVVDQKGGNESNERTANRKPVLVLPAKGCVNPAQRFNCMAIGRIDCMRIVRDRESDLTRRE